MQKFSLQILFCPFARINQMLQLSVRFHASAATRLHVVRWLREDEWPTPRNKVLRRVLYVYDVRTGSLPVGSVYKCRVGFWDLALARSHTHIASPSTSRCIYYIYLLGAVRCVNVRLRISFMEQRRRAAKTLACIQIIGSRRRLLKWWSWVHDPVIGHTLARSRSPSQPAL